MNNRLKKVISIIILIAISSLFAYYVLSNLYEFKKLEISRPLLIILLFAITLFGSIANGIIIKNLLLPFGIKLKVKEWFGLSIITSFYNSITPFRGGAVAKAIYLKKRHDFSYSNFLASLAGAYLITFLSASILGLLSLWLIYVKYKLFNPIILIVFLFFFIPLLLIVIFSPEFPENKNKFINKIIKVMNGWNLIKNNKKIILIITIITLIQLLLSSIGTIISYSVFNINISIVQAIFLVAIGTLGLIIQVTPGNLGTAEAIAVFSALFIGITPVQSIAVAILGRAVSFVLIGILGPIFSYILLKNKKEKADYG